MYVINILYMYRHMRAACRQLQQWLNSACASHRGAPLPRPAAATVPAGPPMPDDNDDACPFCHDSSAPMAASLGIRQQRRRKTATRKRKLGCWGYQAGYSGPRYCQRCSEVFRFHIMEQKPNSADCSREFPCQICVQVLRHYQLHGSTLWAALDAAKKVREDFKAAPGRVQRASRKSKASSEQLLDKQATASASSTHVMSDPRLEDRERRVAQGAARPAPESAERMASNTLAGIKMVVEGDKFGATTQRAQQQSCPARNGSEVVYIRDESELVAQGIKNKRPRTHALHDDSHRVSLHYLVVPAPPAAATVPAGPPMPDDNDDACPFCHDSSAPMAASLGIRQQRRRKTATRKRKLGCWGYQAGYSGPRYCQRCSEVFRFHIMEQKPNSADCSREFPCQICVQVLRHYQLQGSTLWAALDAAKKVREDFKAAPGRVQRASRKSKASSEQCLTNRLPHQHHRHMSCRIRG
eukprot:COSAG01_NODE_1047_length_11943_cov_30.026762_7_plen_468_part_00